MAKDDLAAQWLFENDPKRKSNKIRRVITTAQKKRARRIKIVAYDPWTGRGALRKQADERAAEKLRHGCGITTYAEFCRDFIRKNAKEKGADCLFIPFSIPGERASLSWHGSIMDAARAMCILVKGDPEEGQVARHLCGNGHLSCVNPRHLCWGTPSENNQDTWLHTHKPFTWPAISQEDLKLILESDLPDKVVSVALQIPAALVEKVRDGSAPYRIKP
jgi:hypothetical protein